MIHCLRLQKIPNRSPSGSLVVGLVFAITIANKAAFAGDLFEPKAQSADQARCDTFGEGYYAVKGSNACIKIGGYVAAGADFAAPAAKASGVFAPKPSGGLTSETAVSAEVHLDTPLGPGRLYVQVGRDSYYHP